MKPVVVVNDTRPDRHYGCQAVMDALLVFLAQNGLRPIHFHPVGVPWAADLAFIEAAARAQAVIVNGEGSIHHSNDRAMALAQVGSFCQFTLKRPAILLNATLAANDKRLYSHLRNFRLISVRDHASAAEAKRFGLDSTIYCPDFSMFHDLAGARTARPAAPPVSVGISDSVVKRVTEALAALAARGGFTQSGIGFAPAPGRSIYDYALRIGSLDLLVTGRYHGVCYALATGTPFVAVESNTPKISSLLADVFGETRRVVAPEALAALPLGDYAGWTDAELGCLERFRAVRAAAYRELGNSVRAVLSETPVPPG